MICGLMLAGSYWVQGVRSKSWSSSSERLSLETLFSVEDQRCCLVSMFAGNRSNGYDDSGYFLVSFSVLILFFVFWFRFWHYYSTSLVHMTWTIGLDKNLEFMQKVRLRKLWSKKIAALVLWFTKQMKRKKNSIA